MAGQGQGPVGVLEGLALHLKNGRLLEGLVEGRFRFAFQSDPWGCWIENGLGRATMEALKQVQRLLW